MRHLLIAAAAAALLAGPAAAQDADEAERAASRSELLRILDGNFKSVDGNGDGRLDKGEMEAAAALIASNRIERRFKSLDTNNDSMISLAEFKALTATARAGSGTAAALPRLDSNRDGAVSAEEFRSPLITQFDRLDANKDGQLSADERAKAPPARPPEGR